jgi:hypothetical protein
LHEIAGDRLEHILQNIDSPHNIKQMKRKELDLVEHPQQRCRDKQQDANKLVFVQEQAQNRHNRPESFQPIGSLPARPGENAVIGFLEDAIFTGFEGGGLFLVQVFGDGQRGPVDQPECHEQGCEAELAD